MKNVDNQVLKIDKEIFDKAEVFING